MKLRIFLDRYFFISCCCICTESTFFRCFAGWNTPLELVASGPYVCALCRKGLREDCRQPDCISKWRRRLAEKHGLGRCTEHRFHKKLVWKTSKKRSTLDNRNTFSQIEYLADVYTLTKNKKLSRFGKRPAISALHIKKNNGGWRGWDVDAVTFNDDVTTGTLELFRNILQGDSSFYGWTPICLKQYRSHTIKGLP